jgi:CheY-like chemotaxis protein
MAEMDTLRVVLADDEELGREHLRAYINALNRDGARIELVGTGADGREAVEVVCREKPDVVFLDVSMPDLDGFGVVAELVAKLPEHLPQIVFVTAYDEHAVRAFDLDALDFIQKPLSLERFAQAVARARTAIAQRRQGELHTRLLAWVQAKAQPAASAPSAAQAAYAELKRRARNAGEQEGAIPVGYQVHEYRIERVLGVGGFGMTYLAHDTNLDTRVAIKEYFPRDLAVRDDKSAEVHPRNEAGREAYKRGLERFLLESRTLAAFRHPNIVRVNRFFEANNTAYMVMDYELGAGLDGWMKQRLAQGGAAPDEKSLVRMFVPLLQGLERVHEAGFLHRDIKPANIYVRDADGSLVLLDFGAARQTSVLEAGGMTSIFSPGYSPFEQYHRHGPQGPWSDLYAMGSVLYWFVTGKRPVDAAARIQQDPQEPAAKLAKGRYSQGFLQAIDWALTLDEKSRPQTVAEFLPVLAGDKGALGWIKRKLGLATPG